LALTTHLAALDFSDYSLALAPPATMPALGSTEVLSCALSPTVATLTALYLRNSPRRSPALLSPASSTFLLLTEEALDDGLAQGCPFLRCRLLALLVSTISLTSFLSYVTRVLCCPGVFSPPLAFALPLAFLLTLFTVLACAATLPFVSAV
jgi:hypothetical protein